MVKYNLVQFAVTVLCVVGMTVGAYAKDDPVNQMSVPEDTCVADPASLSGNGSAILTTRYYDTATLNVIEGPYADSGGILDEDAVVMAQSFLKAKEEYTDIVNKCYMRNIDNLADGMIMRECECGPETQLLNLKAVYTKAMDSYPEWKGMILRIPRAAGGYAFVAAGSYAPETLGENCAIYLSD